MKITFLIPPVLDNTKDVDRCFGCNYCIYFLPLLPVLYTATLLKSEVESISILDFAAERNSDKYGARTLGSDIPIISETESRAMKPDYYLVLPWHFKEEFLLREKELLDQGTGMIFPLPEVEVIRR